MGTRLPAPGSEASRSVVVRHPEEDRTARFERSFFARATLAVARDLLGTCLVRRLGARKIAGRIVEVEAYVGSGDSACHASGGRTARNQVMFGPPGRAYVYFTYGMHWMLNVVTEREGFPAAVLIRAVEPLRGLDLMRRHRGDFPERHLTSGPARLCQAFRIDRSLNGADLVEGRDLFLEKGEPVGAEEVAATPRIGVDYAEPEDRDALWRFFIARSPSVSPRRANPARGRPRGRARARQGR